MWFLLLILMTGLAQADNIYYNKSTGQVMNITSDKVILSSDDKNNIAIAALPANFDINTLSKPLAYYNYDGKSITLNTAMVIADDASAVAKAKSAQDTATARASGLAKIKALGLNDSEIDSLFK